MSDSRTFDEQATDITIATIQSLGIKLNIMDDDAVKALTKLISEVYKTTYKTIKEVLEIQ